MKENKKNIVEMLNNQVKEGIIIATDLKVNDKEYGMILTNLLNAFKASEQMGSEIQFDEEQEKLTQEYNKKQLENKE